MQRAYADIVGEEVVNTIVARNVKIADKVAKAFYGEDAFAIYCGDLKVFIGCKYIDGIFYKPDGVTPVRRMDEPEPEE